jgi:hypothetical protein
MCPFRTHKGHRLRHLAGKTATEYEERNRLRFS